jgi:hypothetical protein
VNSGIEGHVGGASNGDGPDFCILHRNVSTGTFMLRGAETGKLRTVEFSEVQFDAIVESQAKG